MAESLDDRILTTLVKRRVGETPVGDEVEQHKSVLDREIIPTLNETRDKFNRFAERPSIPVGTAEPMTDAQLDPHGTRPLDVGKVYLAAALGRLWMRVDGAWGDLKASALTNDSGIIGATVAAALETLGEAIADLAELLDGTGVDGEPLGSSEIVDTSGVPGINDGMGAVAGMVSGALLYLHEYIAAVEVQSVDNGDWTVGGADLSVANGGTGASTAADARTNLGLAYASTAEQETGTATDRVVAPGTQHRHPSAAKMWGRATVSGGTPTLNTSFNITSITDVGAGQLGVTIATDFAAAAPIGAMAGYTTTGLYFAVSSTSQLAGSCGLEAVGAVPGNAPTLSDPEHWFFWGFGDQ